MNASPTQTSTNAANNGFISPGALQRLIDGVPDKESLLTIKFCFHFGTRTCELCTLNSEQDFIYDEAGRLQQFLVGTRSSKTRRYIGVDQSSAQVLVALLPESGPVFLHANPFERLKRLAKGLGIQITSRLARRSCVAHCRLAAMAEEEIAARVGLHIWPWRRHRFIPLGMHQLGGEYFNVRFNLNRIHALPRHSGRLHAAVASNPEEAA